MAKQQSSRHFNDLLRAGNTIALVLAIAFAPGLFAKDEPNSTLMDYRAKLSPAVQTRLEEVCGVHCPSFIIDAAPTPKKRTNIENLGFANGEVESANSEIPGKFVVRVLADESVTPSQVQSLKEILSHTLGNMVSEPVGVEVKKIKGMGEHLKNAALPPPDFFDRFQQVQAAFWPVASLLLGLMTLLALFIVGGYALKVIREKRKSGEAEGAVGALSTAGAERDVSEPNLDLEKILNERALDVQWLINAAAREADHAKLQRVLSMVSSGRLASLVTFENKTLQELSTLPLPEVRNPSAEDKAWFLMTLDQALWQRLHFESRPLARADLLSPYELQKLMSALSTREEKAVLLSHVKREKWAAALVHLPSDERIEVGLLLQEIELGQLSSQAGLEARLEEILQRKGSTEARYGYLVEDYSLYLSESEGRALMSKLSMKPRIPLNGFSLESVLEKLSDHLLLDLCLRANIHELQVLFPTLSKTTQERILRTVPEHLRGRISRLSEVESFDAEDDSAILGARASILSMTRNLSLAAPRGSV